MKYISIITLVFLLAVFPIVSKSQTKKKSSIKKTQNIQKISDEVRVKKIVEQVIDVFFTKRDFASVFRKYFSFAPCDKIDKEILDQNCPDKNDLSKIKFNQKEHLKTITLGSRHMYQPFYFILGTHPINKDSNEAYPYNSLDYDALESEVLKKANLSFPDFDFYKLNKIQIEKRLVNIEKSVNAIEKVIFERINKNLYDKNIQIMKKTIKITITVKKGRKYYGAEIKGLIFGFILTKRSGQLKIVGMVDGI